MFGSAILISICPARTNFSIFKNLHAYVLVHMIVKHILKIKHKTAGLNS